MAQALDNGVGSGSKRGAKIGAASVFGVVSLSDILARVEHEIKGRLVVFFPGRTRDGRYRLLDARDGWDYHAVAIQVENSGVRQ